MQDGSGWKPGRMGLVIVELWSPLDGDARVVGRRHEARTRRVVERNMAREIDHGRGSGEREREHGGQWRKEGPPLGLNMLTNYVYYDDDMQFPESGVNTHPPEPPCHPAAE